MIGLNPFPVVPHFGDRPDNAFHPPGNERIQDFFVVIGWVVYQAKEQGIAQFIGFLLDPHYGA